MYKFMYYRLFYATAEAMRRLLEGDCQEAYEIMAKARRETEALSPLNGQ